MEGQTTATFDKYDPVPPSAEAKEENPPHVDPGRCRMKTVHGRTQSVVVVGAGLAGLSAALHLAGAGKQVTVLEREGTIGGRVGTYEVLDSSGRRLYDIDNGASVLTMPSLIADALAAVGESFESTFPPDHADQARAELPRPLRRWQFPRCVLRSRRDERRDRAGVRSG